MAHRRRASIGAHSSSTLLPRLRPGQAHLLRQVGRRPRPADPALSREAAELVELGYLEVTARGFLAITDAGVEALHGGGHG